MAEARHRLLEASYGFHKIHKLDLVAKVKALKVVSEIETWAKKVEFDLMYGPITELEKLEDNFDALQVRINVLLSDVLSTYT